MARQIVFALGCMTLLPLAACAFDRGDAELAVTQAQTAIESAERNDAAQFAPPDLGAAQSMLAAAHAAYDRRSWIDAVFASENARVDAGLALARSRQHRAEQATAQVERSVDTLRGQLGKPAEGPP